MNETLLFCGVVILILVLVYIGIRIWYNKPEGDYRNSQEFQDRRSKFIDDVKKKNKK